jgi:3D-(3,5/4)-trihydroxycyclohexane-1,2-dione acylhydrolase (decyclizing)
MGATSVMVGSIAEMEEALSKRHVIKGPYVVVIDTDPYPSTEHGGTWWEVAVPEVSARESVREKRAAYVKNKAEKQRAD